MLPAMRGYLRRAWLGLMTVTGMARRGFFIPYRYAASHQNPRGREAYPALAPPFRSREKLFLDHLAAIDRYGEALRAIGSATPPAPRWTQDWFPALDAAAAYAFVRDLKPKRIVEIGSGHSTRFLARAIADGGLGTSLIAIDPAPRADISELRLKAGGLPITIIRKTLQETDWDAFRDVGDGDIVFIDSSHILMPGTDLDLLLNGILPLLPAGTILHLHDIFLPDGYPEAWAWRGYNEQSALGPLLTGGGWEVLFASHYVRSRFADKIAETIVASLPLAPGAFESSLWLRKR
jgi:hypothetical protein